MTSLDDTYLAFAAKLDGLSGDDDAFLAELHRQEAALRFASFSLEDAWTLGQTARGIAARLSLPVAVILFVGHQRAFHSSLPGAAPENDAWAGRKIKAVEHVLHSSLAIATSNAITGDSINDRLPAADYAAAGGAFPLFVGSGIHVGSLGVSGLPSIHDHALVVTAVADFLGRTDALELGL